MMLKRVKSFMGSRLVYLVALLIFMTHFVISWIYSNPELDPNVITVFLEAFEGLRELDAAYIQVNYYTGNFFLLIPLLEFLGYSPRVFRGLMIGLMSLSSSVIFLGVSKKYDLKTGLIGILFLFNSGVWLTFRFVDYTYVLFCVSVMLYVFVLWEKSRERKFVYAFSFLAGLFFYFKAITGYVTVGILLGGLVQYRTFLRDYLSIKTVFIAIFFFSIGISPFIGMTFLGGLDWHKDIITVEDNYEEDFTVSELTELRYSQFNSVIRPHNFVRDHHTKEGSGLPSISLILLATALLISLKTGRSMVYAITLPAVFLLLFYVTNQTSFRQVMVLLPVSAYLFSFLVSLTSSDRIKNVVILFLFISLVIYISELPSYYEDNYPLSEFGHNQVVSQEQFHEYQEMDLGAEVATNNNIIRHMTRYDQDTKGYYLVEKEIRTGSEYDMAALRRYRKTIDDLEAKDSIYFVLSDECAPDLRICGIERSKVKQELDLEISKKKYFDGQKHYIVKTG